MKDLHLTVAERGLRKKRERRKGRKEKRVERRGGERLLDEVELRKRPTGTKQGNGQK